MNIGDKKNTPATIENWSKSEIRDVMKFLHTLKTSQLTGSVQGKEEEKKEMRRQNIEMDMFKVDRSPSEGWKQRRMEKSGCLIILDAPKVI